MNLFNGTDIDRVIPFLFLVILILTHVCEPAAKKGKGGKSKSRSRTAAALNQNCQPGQAFHNDSEQCVEVGSQGPCSEQMIFYADTEAEGFGDCDCEKTECPGQAPVLFWPAEERCYNAFEIGPCDEEEWLMANISGDAECRKNPCLNKVITIEPYKISEGDESEIILNVTTGLSTEEELKDMEDLEGICQCTIMKKMDEGLTDEPTCNCIDHIFVKLNDAAAKKVGISLAIVLIAIFVRSFI